MDETKIRAYARENLMIKQGKLKLDADGELSRAFQIRCFDSLPSTNVYARQWHSSGVKLPALVLADAQTQGRGRLGREFFSPPGGLYMSLIIDCRGIAAGMMTTLAAVSVLEAADILSLPKLQIKWVNDLLLEHKKVGGILAEGILSNGSLAAAVIGIGLNTGESVFPDSIKKTAGSLQTEQKQIDREKLAVLICRQFLGALPCCPGHMAAYRQNCVSIGQHVSFKKSGCLYFGQAIDVDESGALLVETKDGLIRLETGEVSIRHADREA